MLLHGLRSFTLLVVGREPGHGRMLWSRDWVQRIKTQDLVQDTMTEVSSLSYISDWQYRGYWSQSPVPARAHTALLPFPLEPIPRPQIRDLEAGRDDMCKVLEREDKSSSCREAWRTARCCPEPPEIWDGTTERSTRLDERQGWMKETLYLPNLTCFPRFLPSLSNVPGLSLNPQIPPPRIFSGTLFFVSSQKNFSAR